MFPITVYVGPVVSTDEALCNYFVNVTENPHALRSTTKTVGSEFPIAHVGVRLAREADEVLDVRDIESLGAPMAVQGALRYRPNTRIDADEYMVLENANTFQSASRNIHLTNQFAQTGEPLFWRHELQQLTMQQDVAIIDQDGVAISPDRYKIILEANAADSAHVALRALVAHNLVHDLDKGKLYFIVYRDSSNNSVREILNQKPLFRKADGTETLERYSLDKSTTLCVFWSHIATNSYVFQLPLDHRKLAWRYAASHFLQVELPESSLPEETWIPRVSNFEWVLYDGTELRVPEWSDQNFFPFNPTQVVRGDTGRILSELSVVQLSRRGIFPLLSAVGQTHGIDLLFYEVDAARPSLALTNNPAKDKQAVPGEPELAWKYALMSVVYEESLVYVDANIADYSTVVASYPVESQSVDIPHFDLNPYRNKSLLGKRIIYYLNPYTQAALRTVEALVIDEDGIITNVTQEGNHGTPSMIGWIDKPYREYDVQIDASADIRTGRIPIQVFVGQDWFTTNVLQGSLIVIGDFVIPEHLLEYDGARLTDVRGYREVSQKQLAESNIFDYRRRESRGGDVLSVPALTTGQQVRVHWAHYKDFIGNKIMSQDNLRLALRSVFPAGTTWAFDFHGVPSIVVENILWSGPDIFNVMLRWLPVAYPHQDIPVGGVLYSGSTKSKIDQLVATYGDLSVDQWASVSIMKGERRWYKIRPFVVIGGQTWWGPDSNILAITI